MESISFRPPPSLFGTPNTTQVGTSLGVRANHAPPPPPPNTTQTNAVGVRSSVETPSRLAPSWTSFRRPLWKLWPGTEDVGVEVQVEEDGGEQKRGSWVSKILHVGSMWGRRRGTAGGGGGGNVGDTLREGVGEEDCCVGCCQVEEDEVVFDQGSFSRLLRKVSLAEASLYSRLSYLGLLAYSVSKIKRGNLLGSRGLRFVTSSLEKRAVASDVNSAEEQHPEIRAEKSRSENGGAKNGAANSAAYEIAASAASYVQSRAKNILSFRNSKGDSDSSSEDVANILSCEESSFVATTNSVTAVVAAEEEVKEAVAKDLNSPRSSPCEWFICDDESSKTRYFVIQGSESLASWQANLLFEPIQFEGLDFAVHRGIYEAAKGIYEHMLPEVQAHLESHGKLATLQFTGHSLGGSLSLLVNLMLLIRGEIPASSLLPVVTFGSPSILCGGNLLLQKLGLPLNHVQAVMMHRDIVPRAFSCNYPDHVAEILKAVNKNFRNHPCLHNKKLLYEPMGELLILQPDEKSSPHHHLLPSGSGLYALTNTSRSSSRSLIRMAQSFFLNSPHPLEILSDRSAYGSNGTVTRDHDMTAYVHSVRAIIQSEVKRMRRVKMERRRWLWATLVVTGDVETDLGEPASDTPDVSSPLQLARIAGMFHGGAEPLKRFGRLVASQHVHLLVLTLLPARVLIAKALAVVSLFDS